MRRGADAALSRPRYLGLATLVLSGLCVLGLATSQALAGQVSPLSSSTELTTTSAMTAAPPPPAPIPDPKPDPTPDPKPARPKQPARAKPPPPPPPPSLARAPRRQIATTAQPATAPQKTRARPAKAVPPKRPAQVRRARRPDPPVRRRKAAKAEQSLSRVAARPVLDLAVPPAPSFTASAPSVSVAIVLPLVGVGILLLLGASVASARRVPWPELAEPLYAHRNNLATVGIGAIALALLWLNAAVFF